MMSTLSRRTILKGTLAGIAVGPVLAACTRKKNEAGSTGTGGATLSYWASNQGTSLENDKEVLTPILDEFSKQTGNQVNLEVIGWGDLQTRIQTAVTSGQGPDVCNIGNTWAVSLQATGGFLELGDSEMQAIGGKDKFVQVALMTGGAEGQPPTSVPLYGLAYGLFYNKKMFKDAGLKPPNTWEELVSSGQALTKGGVYGLSLAAGSYTENNHFAFINSAQNGADLFDSEGKPDFTNDGVVDGVLRYLNLMQRDKIVNISNAQYDNGTQSITDFAQGKAAMILNQNNAVATILANGMDIGNVGVVPFPAPKDSPSKVASHIAGINISIFKNTKNRDAALAFVKYMTSPAVQEKLGKPFNAIPVLKEGKPTFSTEPDMLKMFPDIYNNRSKPLPLVPTEDQFETNVGKAMNNMFANIATGKSVSRDDVRVAMKTAQDAIR